MLLSIRIAFLLLITAPVMYLSTELLEGLSTTTDWSTFMQGDYEEQWKAVDKALDEGLPKTALELVEKIFERARRENNRPQTVKAVSYRVALRAVTSEEDEAVLIGDLEKEIEASEQPVRAILTSMLADLYWGYYQQNRWRIHERTQVEDDPEADFRTWDASVFFDTTTALYLRSLEPAQLLKESPVADYHDILYWGQRSAQYRPTMYDILAHRALDFFENDESDLPSPQRDFEVSGLEALTPLGAFLATEFTSPNPVNPKYNAILLYQDLLRFHRGAEREDAVIDLDLLRLEYGRRITVHEDKDTTFFKAVESIYDAYASSPMSAQAGYVLADYMFDKSDYVSALARCRKEMERFPDSRGAVNCRALESQILQKELALTVEESMPPEQPFLLSAGFRNITDVHFRIVRVPSEDLFSRQGWGDREEWLTAMLSGAPVQQWSQQLPATSDYKTHTVDLRGPALPLGTYMLFMSHGEDFSLIDNAIAYTWLRVTRLSLQSVEEPRGGAMRFWVLDAEDGSPLPGVRIEAFTQEWSSGGYRYERVRLGSETTDRNGMFSLAPGRHRNGVFFRLSKGTDTLAIGESFYAWDRGNREQTQRRTMFFTDRAIYRPGQAVYVKGIVLEGSTERADFSVVKGVSSTVILYDANNEKVHEQQVRTNEYGSFNTVFTVPSGVLTGRMSIRNEWGSITVRVEEYKRPKFEVEFQPVKGTYRLNETVKVQGIAKAYAGANIDGAEVSWRVVRRTRYPYWFWWWRPFPRSEDREIAHGTTTTDGDGTYEISFEAIPDGSVDKSTQPVFTYEISADVTDINGETHSATTSVSAGYTSIELGIRVAEMLDVSEDGKVTITARNLGGEPVAVDGTIIVELLDPPDRILRERFLPKPDTWLLSEEEFLRDFPHDVYRDENISDTWPVAERVIEQRFRCGEEGEDSLRLEDLDPGRYRITLKAKDPSGEDLELKRFITAYDAGGRMPYPAPEMYVDKNMHVEPGETARFLFGSAYSDVKALYRVDHRGTREREEWLDLDGALRSFALKAEERHRGGFSALVFFVRDYRLYQRSVVISVPWSNKDLDIETATFRDKLRPGQEEEWRLTIRGKKRDQVAAEVLASMYDASLDAIYQQDWPRFTWPFYAWQMRTSDHSFGGASAQLYMVHGWNSTISYDHLQYDRLRLFLLDRGGYLYGGRAYMLKSGGNAMALTMEADAAPPSPAAADGMLMSEMEEGRGRREKSQEVLDTEAKPGESPESDKAGDTDLDMVKARTNFNETAFFYPDLMTDEEGNVVLRFTAPEALTRWKLRVYAHTPDLKTGYLEKTTVTQKELMVMPNMPRFMREGDRIVLMTKITNLSDTALSGIAVLKLFDAISMQPLDEAFDLRDAERSFAVEKGRSTTARWEVHVPEGLSAVTYRIVAKAGDFSDGEEMALPVLPNRMLVTETLPLNIRGGETKEFTFEKLVRSGSSSTLRQHQLTLEMTSQPAWYAVQALPYLMEYPYECSEQVFNRYYANSIASHIANSNPKIKRVFDAWKNTDALLSNLQKNQDLKALLLEETPWVMQGKDESERKKRIALLFDLNTMGNNLESAMRKLEQAQASNGGWPWFPGLPESRYITQYIVAGFGHLAALDVTVRDERTQRMIRRAVNFMDERMYQDYLELKKRERKFDPDKDYLDYLSIQYLYARSYFLDQEIPDRYDEAVRFWMGEARKWWARRNYMAQGMIALGLHRFKDTDVPIAVVRSLRERALQNEEMGMYWKYDRGWFWYQAPIETQALLIEVFDEIANDLDAVEEMKIWLLKQKQVQDWGTTVATAEACYALLRRGSNLLASDKLVQVTMGGERIDPKAMGADIEAGTGYYRVDWRRGEIEPDMGRITVKKEDQGIAWGAVYWQYFEQLDKITPAQSPLQIEKKLFLQRNTEKGVVLEPITEDNPLRVGDVLKVRVTIRVDRDMEYVHMKDMRGAGLELIEQLSGHRYQGGLVYYEAPRDASVNFFFHWLRKGVHVFEYPLRVSHEGTFSNGISSIQCMYAPEFAAHTAGVTVRVRP